MKVELLNIKNGETWDITNAAESIELNSTIYDQAGSCQISLVEKQGQYPRGSIISLKVDGKGVFYGYIFQATRTHEGKLKLVAYDQLRYFKNEDTIFTQNKTTDKIFVDLAKKFGLNYKVVNPSSFVNLPYLHEKKSMFAILKHLQEETFSNTGKMYIVRDNFGALEFVDMAKQKTSLIIGNQSLMTSYDYTLGIDKDTYNAVKLGRDNQQTQKRDIWQVEDSSNIKKWGRLQFYDTVDEEATEAQIKELAKNILQVKNRETSQLSLSAIGFYNLRAGDGIKVELIGLVNQWFYLQSVKTSIKNNYAEMDLEVFIP